MIAPCVSESLTAERLRAAQLLENRFVTDLAWDLQHKVQILSLVNMTRDEEGYLTHNKTITVLGLGVLLAGALTLSMLVPAPDPTGLLLVIVGSFALAVRRGYFALRRARI